VLIPHSNRSTCCVSSQIGCAMGCKFCATGTMGILGDLHFTEILEQLMYAKIVNKNQGRLNCVFMGMGEPLRNYNNVRDTVLGMLDEDLFGMARRHITVSTVGVVENIEKLTKDLPGVSLALSLHAATQKKRESIVPTAKAWPLDKLMNAMDRHFRACEQYLGTKRFAQTRMMIEYVLLKNVNDTEEDADALASLLGKRPALGLNLIPYNPNVTAKMYGYEAPTVEEAQAFREMCRKRGLFVTLRIEHGQDISAACGQLVISDDIEDAGTAAKKKKKNEKVLVKRKKKKSGLVKKKGLMVVVKKRWMIKFASVFLFLLSVVFLVMYIIQQEQVSL
jgi:adenine C2-methylase RlmN of 23S rRNA A2503 and tRNA A37